MDEKLIKQVTEKILQPKLKLQEKGLPDGGTIWIEFARACPLGTEMPPDPPFGNSHSLPLFSPQILKDASIISIHTTTAESRFKNFDRAKPPKGEEEDTGIWHAVPTEVMLQDYGVNDLPYLLSISDKSDTITIHAHGTTYHVPAVLFDNHVDKTTFVREPQKGWDPEDVERLHRELKRCMNILNNAQRH